MDISKSQLFLGQIEAIQEKWNTDYETPEKKKGMWSGWSQADLKAELGKLKASGPHSAGSPKTTRMRQINFALRAKGAGSGGKWGTAK